MLEMLMIRPERCGTMVFSTAFVSSAAATRLTSITRRHSAVSKSARSTKSWMIGVVDEHVDPAEALDRPVGDEPDAIELGEIRGDGEPVDVLRERVQLVLRARRDDDFHAGAGERDRNGAADALACARHDG